MEILVQGLQSGYEVEHLARIFFPGAPLRQSHCTKGPLVYAKFGAYHTAVALRTADGKVYVRRSKREAQGDMPHAQRKLALSRHLYNLLCEATGHRPPWGMLTGVRPVRLLRKQLGRGRDDMQAIYDVSAPKHRLIQSIEQLQRPILAGNTPRSYSLYVSIPFCPTRCAYCSFVSQTIQREGYLIPQYLDKLERELAQIAELAAANGLQLETVYIGGGTPTALDMPGLTRVLQAVEKNFSPKQTREYTVEAGRPDCTGYDKLSLLKEYGVNRISINPQSLQAEVLHAIGRKHSPEDIIRCFEDARRAGLTNINADLIAGLPRDTAAGFANTLDGVLKLAPENITVHTLTLKRASNLVLENRQAASVPGAMLAGAYPRLAGAGYVPYYLYRQKNTVENLENTGWTKPGQTGYYNVYIMEEAHTILAAGAGASTKLVAKGGDVIKRLYNHKLPLEYIQRHNELLERKEGVSEFYARYLDTETTG